MCIIIYILSYILYMKMHIFTATFDQFIASLLYKSRNLF